MGDDDEVLDHPHLDEVRDLEDRIKPILAGHPPEVQGALLADLLSLWVAGHAPDLREDILGGVMELVWKLVPINEMLLFGPGGHPGANKGNA